MCFEKSSDNSWSHFCEKRYEQISPSMHDVCPVFPAYHMNAFMISYPQEFKEYVAQSDSSMSFVGLEPYGDTVRTLRYSTFLATTLTRFALMLDSGAPESCVGMLWIERFLKELQITNATWSEHCASLSGIGAGAAQVNWKVTTPIGIKDFTPALWTSQVLEGVGKAVPALLGLQPMTALGGVIDLRDLSLTVDNTSKIRQKLQCFYISGHLMLPVDWGGQPMSVSRSSFCQDPLGISLWYGQEEKPVTSVSIESGVETEPCFQIPLPIESDHTNVSSEHVAPWFQQTC